MDNNKEASNRMKSMDIPKQKMVENKISYNFLKDKVLFPDLVIHEIKEIILRLLEDENKDKEVD